MNERIRKLRKSLGMTQQEFADKLGVKPNTLSQYETGRNAPTPAVLQLMCRVFDVNENWLRTGEGEMFTEKSRQQEIEKFLSDVANGSDFKRRLVLLLAQMTEDEWALMERMLRKISEEI